MRFCGAARADLSQEFSYSKVMSNLRSVRVKKANDNFGPPFIFGTTEHMSTSRNMAKVCAQTIGIQGSKISKKKPGGS